MCTTMILTRGAVADGSMLVTHSDDDELSDQRIIHVPQKNNPGPHRKVLRSGGRYPRLVTQDRGPRYKDHPKLPEPYPDTPAIGTINFDEIDVPVEEEVRYAYFDGNYGIANEHNLMMGECTSAAKYQPGAVTEEEASDTDRHVRFLYSDELSRIALERCRTAEQAVRLMGALIDKYGFFSYGETLLVVDEKEGWVFEMCALPDEKFHSAWVARRVPEGEMFVAANTFRIREVDSESSDFLVSKHLFDGLKQVGYWNPDEGPLDWMRAVSPGEYGHPYYSLRRIWRVYDRVNPDLGLSPWVKGGGYTRDYPFSVKPKRPLELREVFGLYRDHYEGTEFDLTRGVAAGPYGDPHRFFGPYQPLITPVDVDGYPRGFAGAWERPISVFSQGYSFVGQIRRDPPGAPKKDDVPEATQGLVWMGLDVSYTSCFVPFFTKVSDLPEEYQVGDPQHFPCLCGCGCGGDEGKQPPAAWWAFDFVGNWCRLNFQRMTQVDILPLQAKLERALIGKLPTLDAKVRKLSKKDAIKAVTAFCTEEAGEVVKKWWQLARTLIAKYADGYVNRPSDAAAQEVGYPAAWLRYANYADGPTSYDEPVKS